MTNEENEKKTTKMFPTKRDVDIEDKTTKIIREIKTDVPKPKLVKTFTREKETDNLIWEEEVQLFDNGQEVVGRRTKKRKAFEYPELTLIEKQTKEREIRKKLEEHTTPELEKELKIVMGATVKDTIVLDRGFTLKTRHGLKQHLEVGLKYAEGKWNIDKLGYSGASFELKDGLPSRIWSRFGTQPWVFDVSYEGEIPEGYKKLVNKELYEKIESMTKEIEKATVDFKESTEKSKQFYEAEIAKLEQSNAEMVYCLKKIEDDKLLNKIKRTFS